MSRKFFDLDGEETKRLQESQRQKREEALHQELVAIRVTLQTMCTLLVQGSGAKQMGGSAQ